jgi:hypothetical protein
MKLSYATRSGTWVRVGGTVGGMDAVAEATGTYVRRVSPTRTHVHRASSGIELITYLYARP